MLTLIFSANQALLAARAGAAYVSPFLGRLDDVIFDRDIVIGGFVSRYLLEYEENIRQRLTDKYSFDTDGRYFSISSCTSERTDTGAAIMFLSEFINSI